MSNDLQPKIDNLIENQLFFKAIEVIQLARNKIVNTLYSESTRTYFELGRLIVEEEQEGREKSKYGTNLIKNLSRELTAKFGKGYSVTTLKSARLFYTTYQKSQSATDLFKLSFTHYVELIRLIEVERIFYEYLAISENLSVKDLKRSINSNTILRVMKSKENPKELSLQLEPENPKDIIKDPIIAEFLGFSAYAEGDESKIEKALVDNLEKFLLELGKGFAFVGRQYKLNIDGSVFKTDLVFYNLILRRYVILELKARKAQHKDIGQLQMYVNYFDREICHEQDNPTIGILLCKDKNKSVIDYTLPLDNQTIFTSELMLYLPTKKELLSIISDK